MTKIKCRYVVEPKYRGDKYHCDHPLNCGKFCLGARCTHIEVSRKCQIAGTLFQSNIAKIVQTKKVTSCGFADGCIQKHEDPECSEEEIKEWADMFLAPF